MALFTNNPSILHEVINPRRNFAVNAVYGSCGRAAKYCNYYNTSGCRYGKECWFTHQSNPNSVNQVLLNQINALNQSILQSNMLIKQLNDNQTSNTQQLNQKIDNILLQINKMNGNQTENNIKINEEINNTIKNTMTVGEEYIIENILEQLKTHTVLQMNNLRMDFSLIHHQLMDSMNNMLQMSQYSHEIDLQCEFNTATTNIESKTQLKSNEEIIDNTKLDIQYDINTASIISQSDANTILIRHQSNDELKLDQQNKEIIGNKKLDIQYDNTIFNSIHIDQNKSSRDELVIKAENKSICIDETKLSQVELEHKSENNLNNNSYLLSMKKDYPNYWKEFALCSEYPSCNYRKICKYYHPRSKKEYKEIIKDDLCWKYPNCPYGDNCIFEHVSSDEENIT